MKQWVAEPYYGRVTVTVSDAGVHVHVADEVVQRHYARTCDLAEYATESATSGWVSLRSIVAKDFEPAHRVEIESYIAALLRR